MRTRKIWTGEQADINAITDADGHCPVLDFLNRLDARAQKRLLMLFDLFGKCGRSRNSEMFEEIGVGIWAIKNAAFRIFCFFTPHAAKTTLVLTHAIDGKDNTSDSNEVLKAEQYLRRFIRKG
ncbi:MAG: type II toxin-antitoxin system RelE/ParE family toxin [Bacteroidia bacterium]|nr:type II toxin-antitoxin system RelE/ParE family toxin [Bacteroidia bacterium]